MCESTCALSTCAEALLKLLEALHTRKTWLRIISVPASVLSKTKSAWEVIGAILHHHTFIAFLRSLSILPIHFCPWQHVYFIYFILIFRPLVRCWAARLVERCRKLLYEDVFSGFKISAAFEPLKIHLQAAEEMCSSAQTLLEGWAAWITAISLVMTVIENK